MTVQSSCPGYIDGDGDVDADDLAEFQNRFSGPTGDCNDNGQSDLLDIATGVSFDRNADAIPDECTCPADITRDGAIGLDDLALLLANFGSTGPDLPGDIDHDDDVDLADFLP